MECIKGRTVLANIYKKCEATLRRVKEYELDGVSTIPERELKG